jgi:subtilisin family serine protease
LGRLRAGGQSVETMRASGAAIDRDGALDVFIRGTVTLGELEAAGAHVRTALPGLFTASVPAAVVERVEALDGVAAIRGGAPCEPELDVSVPTTGAQALRGPGPSFAGVNGQGVVIGIVDSGVDYGHGDFQDPSGATRIVSIWDQVASGTGPPGYPYGKECTSAQIDAGTCTERDSLEHGTHAAGIAAGDGSQSAGALPAYTFAGMAPRADLVVVKTDFQTPDVIDAIHYVFDKATERGENAVVNLSLGSQFGSHDGASDFEQAVTALAGPGRIVVKSAGNDRGKAVHAQVFATAPGAPATLSVAGSVKGSYFYIDGYYNATERLRVRMTTPNGTIIGPLVVNTENAPWPGTTTGNGVVYVAHDSLSGGRKNVYIEVYSDQTSHSMNGTWTITFFADHLGPANGEVDLWRYLAASTLAANFVTGNLPTQELITEPGNASQVVTVGAWVTKTSWTACNGVVSSYAGMPAAGNLAPFSSPGPTRDGRQKPDLVAPGTAVGSTTSFDIPHACPVAPAASEFLNDGMNHRMLQGTSMSAPHVTGAVALLLQVRGALTPQDVTTYLCTHARADGFTGTVPSKDWGYGKLDLGDLIVPVVQVVSPNGGEQVMPGETMTLGWTATDSPPGSVTAVDLQLSRTGPGGPFENLALGIANTGSFDWTVTDPITNGSAAYLRVLAHDTNANVGLDLSDAAFTIAAPLAVGGGEPLAFALGPVSPNPAPRGATIAFSVARESRVRLRVLDVQGRAVAVLADGVLHAGRHRVSWEGTRGGAPAPTGLYFVCYDTPEGRFVRRVALAH